MFLGLVQDGRMDSGTPSKFGGSETLRVIFSSAPDVADALLSRQEGGRHLDVGFSGLVHEEYNGAHRVVVGSIPALRSDVLLQDLHEEPKPAALDELDVDASPILSVFDGSTDVVALSIEPDVNHEQVWMNRDSGFLIDLSTVRVDEWSPTRMETLKRNWFQTGAVKKDQYEENLHSIVKILKTQTDARLIVFNGSTFDPADSTHNYSHMPPTVSERIRRLNLALLDVSIEEGISIVDVDRIAAELGGSENVEGVLEYLPLLQEAICREFLRIIDDIGFFEQRPLLPQRGRHMGA